MDAILFGAVAIILLIVWVAMALLLGVVIGKGIRLRDHNHHAGIRNNLLERRH